jgi:hypothetical protein
VTGTTCEITVVDVLDDGTSGHRDFVGPTAVWAYRYLGGRLSGHIRFDAHARHRGKPVHSLHGISSFPDVRTSRFNPLVEDGLWRGDVG